MLRGFGRSLSRLLPLKFFLLSFGRLVAHSARSASLSRSRRSSLHFRRLLQVPLHRLRLRLLFSARLRSRVLVLFVSVLLSAPRSSRRSALLRLSFLVSAAAASAVCGRRLWLGSRLDLRFDLLQEPRFFRRVFLPLVFSRSLDEPPFQGWLLEPL